MYRLNTFNKYLPQNFGNKRNNMFIDIDKDYMVTFLHTPYNIPEINDMLIVLPFFNPCNSVRILQNLLLIKSKLDHAKIPYVIIHCLFPDSNSIAHESDNYMIVKSNSYAFVKENISNIVIKKYIDKYEKFVIHDCDIIFKESDWYTQVSQKLNSCDIIQPYSYYNSLDYNFVDSLSKGRSAFEFYHENDENKYIGHPGYLLAFTKTFWKTHRYPEEALLGGGDTLMCCVVLKSEEFLNFNNKTYIKHMYDKYINEKEIKSGYVPCTIYHLYHNSLQNRQYNTRYQLLDKYIKSSMSIYDIIIKNDDGVYEWIDSIRDSLNDDILNYFKNRSDDEIQGKVYNIR
jgi:hypothetical protein